MSNIHEALLAVQEAAPKVQADAINPHFGNRYATLGQVLEVILPLLTEQGVLLSQRLERGGIATSFVHVKSGTEDHSWMPMPANDNPQKVGSAITYYRRYALMTALSLVGDEDDDAEAAVPTASFGSTPSDKPLF